MYILTSSILSRLCCFRFKSGNVLVVNVNKKNTHIVQRLRGHEDEIHSIAWRHCTEDLGGTEGRNSHHLALLNAFYRPLRGFLNVLF